MKKYLKLLVLAIFAIMSFAFVACGDDDDDDELDKNGNNSSCEGCQYATRGLLNFDGKYLISISDHYIKYDSEGRVNEVYTPYESEFKFDYDNCSFTSESDGVFYRKGSISFNKEGYISCITCYQTDGGKDWFEDDELNVTMTYNSDGNLIELVYSEENIGEEDNEEYEDILITTYKFIWENGNLTHVNIIDKDNWNGHWETSRYEVLFKYGTQINHFKQFPYDMYYTIDEDWEWGDACCVFAAVGLLGKGPVNLPISYDNDGYGPYSTEFKLNPNGSIAEEDWKEYVYGNAITKSYLPNSNKIRSKELKQKTRREKRKSELRNRRNK